MLLAAACPDETVVAAVKVPATPKIFTPSLILAATKFESVFTVTLDNTLPAVGVIFCTVADGVTVLDSNTIPTLPEPLWYPAGIVY